MEIIEYISSISLIIVTGVLCYFTYCLWIETQRMRKNQTSPKVVAKVLMSITHRGFLELKIKNEGNGHAENVNINFKGDDKIFNSIKFTREGIQEDFLISKTHIIKNGIPFISPGEEFIYVLGQIKFNEKWNEKWNFEISYEDKNGEKYIDNYKIDFNIFDRIIPENYMKDISDNIKKISDKLNLTN